MSCNVVKTTLPRVILYQEHTAQRRDAFHPSSFTWRQSCTPPFQTQAPETPESRARRRRARGMELAWIFWGKPIGRGGGRWKMKEDDTSN